MLVTTLRANPLQVSFEADTLLACDNQPFTLLPQVSGGTLPYTFSWNTGDSSSSLTILPPTGFTTYQLTVRDAFDSVAQVQVVVEGLEECVWPGDANGDGQANNLDLLMLGKSFDATGSLRPNAHLNWIAQPAPAWQHVFASGVNYAHADTDGDGHIYWADSTAIKFNYVQPQTLGTSLPDTANGIPLYVNMPNSPVQAGQTITAPIILGSANRPATNIYGLVFSIEYDITLVDSGSVRINYDNSWLGTRNQDLLALDKDFFASGQVDLALTRVDLQTVNGYGRVGDIIITVDDIIGKQDGIEQISLRVKHVYAVDANQNPVLVSPESSQLDVILDQDESLPLPVSGYPNPAREAYFLSLPEAAAPFSDLRGFDTAGREVLSQRVRNGQTLRLDLTDWLPGVYWLELRQGEQRQTVKLIKVP
jgi:hypothetical protein